jgi:hypothetical protein
MKPIAQLSDDEFSQQMRRALRDLPDAPAALQRAAVNLWVAPAPGLLALAQEAIRQIAAVLSFDSWSTAAVAQGMRSVRSPTRHLLFSAEGRDIDLRISPAAEAFGLAGQILGPDEGGTVSIGRVDGADGSEGVTAEPRVATLDALGAFRIDGLSAGAYRLTLHVGNEQIVLPPVQVGEPAGDSAH